MDYNLNENQQKDIASLNQYKGQLEASINKVEEYLDRDEFEDYCDAMATCTAYILKINKRIKDSTLYNNSSNITIDE